MGRCCNCSLTSLWTFTSKRLQSPQVTSEARIQFVPTHSPAVAFRFLDHNARVESNQTYFAKSDQNLLLVAPVVSGNWTSKDSVFIWSGCRCTPQEVKEVSSNSCITFCSDNWSKNFSFGVRMFQEGAYNGPWSGTSQPTSTEQLDFQTAIASSSCCIKESADGATVLVEWTDGQSYDQTWNEKDLEELLLLWLYFASIWFGTYFIIHLVAVVVFTKVSIRNRETVFWQRSSLGCFESTSQTEPEGKKNVIW